jgi:hypothetical protein
MPRTDAAWRKTPRPALIAQENWAAIQAYCDDLEKELSARMDGKSAARLADEFHLKTLEVWRQRVYGAPPGRSQQSAPPMPTSAEEAMAAAYKSLADTMRRFLFFAHAGINQPPPGVVDRLKAKIKAEDERLREAQRKPQQRQHQRS